MLLQYAKKNWKKKLFRFLVIVNDYIKSPVLFSLKLLKKSINKLTIKEFLQVILQYSSNTYLHRLRIYTEDRKMKKIIDEILENIIDKAQKKIARITPAGTRQCIARRELYEAPSQCQTHTPQYVLPNPAEQATYKEPCKNKKSYGE